MRIRRGLLGLLGLSATIALTGCAEVDLTISDEGALRIGMECDYAPFNWTTSTSSAFTSPIVNLAGSYADGYDVQIANYLSDELDRDVEIYAYEWDALILNLLAGEIDLIIAGMSPTEKRKKQIEFTNSYYTATHVVLVGADDTTNGTYANATQLSDFAGANAVAQTGTVYADLVEQLVGVNEQTSLDSVSDVVNALNSNAADISIVERPVAQAIIKANDKLSFVELSQTFVLDEADKIVSIGLNYGNDSYVEAINTALSKLTDAQRDAYMSAAVERQG